MSDRLQMHKFRLWSNPHGILFNPLSVCRSLQTYLDQKIYEASDLFPLHELWNSWDHHTRFSDIHQQEALRKINTSQQEASAAIRDADWILITLGSAFQYYLKEKQLPVANNHRAPAQWFEKKLLSIEEIANTLRQSIDNIRQVNPGCNIMFTISPVRHIRDGVVDNNRSKARLLEAVHSLCDPTERCFYFPAYEIVIDILRDYRFYDIDFVHPNYLATQIVWEYFAETVFAEDTRSLMKRVQEIVTAKNHRPRFPDTQAHKAFRKSHLEKILQLQQHYPYLDLAEEAAFFAD